MTYFPVASPFEIFFDLDGNPLEEGYIYIGEANQNPITNQITVYWDSTGLYPAAQPIRTIDGYPDRNGSAAKIYVNAGAFEDYSILINDKNGRLVFYAQSARFDDIASGNTVDLINDLRSISGYSQPIYIRGHSAIGDGGEGQFEWFDGAAPGTYVDDNGITIVPTGGDGSFAWIRQYKKNKINVKWYNAGNGDANDTSKFTSALAVGNWVHAPDGVYPVSNITLKNGCIISGDSRVGTIFEVITNDTGAFYAETAVARVTLRDFAIKAASGVTGARGFNHIDHSDYASFCRFINIETYLELEYAYYGFFIFQVWQDCRDGYNGSSVGGQTHTAIYSNPASYGQAKQTNLNQVLRCQFFRSDSVNGAVDISYGAAWTFGYCDFEALETRPIKAAGIYSMHIHDCWIEDCDISGTLIQLDSSPAPAIGVYAVEIDNCFISCHVNNTYFIGGNWANNVSLINLVFVVTPVGMLLCSREEVIEMRRIVSLSGISTSDFIGTTKQSLIDANIRDSEAEITVINSPANENINVLPIGPWSLGQANFTSAGFNAKIDQASVLNSTYNAIRFQVLSTNNYAYYSFPAKLVTFLQDRTITLAGIGYGDATAVADGCTLRIWDSVTPDATNHAASSGTFIDISKTTLQTGYVSYTVSSSCTSLHIGIRIGGANSLKYLYLEILKVVLGEIKPELPGFN